MELKDTHLSSYVIDDNCPRSQFHFCFAITSLNVQLDRGRRKQLGLVLVTPKQVVGVFICGLQCPRRGTESSEIYNKANPNTPMFLSLTNGQIKVDINFSTTAGGASCFQP